MLNFEKFKFFFSVLLILQLFHIFFYRSSFNFEVFKNSFSKNETEIFAVSPEVVESRRILERQKVNSFNLSDEIKNDTYYYQRFIEFNYPIRLDEDSNLYFFLKEEKIPIKCELKESGKYLKLIYC